MPTPQQSNNTNNRVNSPQSPAIHKNSPIAPLIRLPLLSFLSVAGKSKIYCERCQKKCTGEVLRVTDRYFHKTCFQCTKCQKSLAQGGFFSKDGAYYCTADYQRLYGTKCAACNLYVEGEVVSTLGKTYHQKCFTCSKCKSPFKSGSKVRKQNCPLSKHPLI